MTSKRCDKCGCFMGANHGCVFQFRDNNPMKLKKNRDKLRNRQLGDNNVSKRLEVRAKMSEIRLANVHRNNNSNYKRITIDGKSMWEHKYIWLRYSEWHFIPSGWVVHHRNEDRSDNRIENLVCLPFGFHKQAHRWIENIRLGNQTPNS